MPRWEVTLTEELDITEKMDEGVFHQGGQDTVRQGRRAFLKEEKVTVTTTEARTSPGGRVSGRPFGNTQVKSP